MDFHVMTLFPDMIMQGLSDSVIGRAVRKGTIGLHTVNIRDYSLDKHKHVDDYPYGGGAGMVMQPEPIYACYQDIVGKMDKKPRVIYMTPQGRVFSQEIAEELSKEESLIFLCGHYEGIDERVLDEIVTDHSFYWRLCSDRWRTAGHGDDRYHCPTGAEVLNNSESAEYDSFQDGLLEYPQYTRPEIWHDKQVPEVLLSGHHGNIEKWRRQQSLKRTFERRPELLEQEEVQEALTKKDREYLSELENPEDTL